MPTLPKTCLVTGASGFIGRNLTTALRRLAAWEVLEHNSGDGDDALADKIRRADTVFHLAGVNRHDDDLEFERTNVGLTQHLTKCLASKPGRTDVVFTSSTQAGQNHAYGRSKQTAENLLLDLAEHSPHDVAIYRLPNVFGKWSRPHYNTVVATFCHQIARGLPISIDDPASPLQLVYIDEVVRCLLRHLDPEFQGGPFVEISETDTILVGELAEMIQAFRAGRDSLQIPRVDQRLTKQLHATYLSFVPPDDLARPLEVNADQRGHLFEIAKSDTFGQIFVSTTKPGLVRGNHYHDSKVEKFCLIRGRGIIRFRDLGDLEMIEYPVDDRQIRVVDIPPGMTHSIENTGHQDMVVLFWANEVNDPEHPDTHWAPVIADQ